MQTKLLTFIILLFTFCNKLSAKEVVDTSYLPDVYYNTFHKDLPVHSGRLFLGYPPKTLGSPYIPLSGWDSGAVLYNNIWYKTGALKLDTHTDELVVQTPSLFSVMPISYRISAFLLGEKKFIRIDSTRKNRLANGFYEVLEDGPLKVLAKRKALLEQKIEQLTLEHEFVRTDEFYILDQDRVNRINSKSDLYNLVKDKKRLIKKTLRPLRLNYRKNKELLILKAVEIYNQN